MKPESDFLSPLSISDETYAKFSADEQFLLKPLKSVALNMEVMVKFHRNQVENQTKKNPFVSWTLNKVSVIDRKWLEDVGNSNPIQDMDWWRVKIENETSPGQPVGCFILRPLWKVDRNDLAIYLSPSTWTPVQHGLTVLLYPKIRPWMPWIIPKALRNMVMKKTSGAALVIPLSYPPEGDPKESYRGEQSRNGTESGDLATVISDPEVTYKS